MMNKIIEPTLLIKKEICLENIKRIALKASSNNLIFRPHFKTHQSSLVGRWFRDAGISSITVSSVSMAIFFSKNGWKDITIAFPLNPREIERIDRINADVEINILVENIEVLDLIHSRFSRPLGVFIKIDTGYNRTGITYSDNKKISSLIKKIEEHKLLSFKGFLIHAGHTYNCSSKEEVLSVHKDSVSKIKTLRSFFEESYPNMIVSYGDTPSCSLADDFTGINEIRPGNFVYYDLMQLKIGSCSIEDIAAVVACPVVAKHPDRQQLIIHGGAVHFSKEFYFENDSKIFGKQVLEPTRYPKDNEPEGILISLSQEHGILEITDQQAFDQIKIGQLVYILPVHSCLTANLLSRAMIV